MSQIQLLYLEHLYCFNNCLNWSIQFPTDGIEHWFSSEFIISHKALSSDSPKMPMKSLDT